MAAPQLQILPDVLVVNDRMTLRLPRRSDGPQLIAAVQDPEIPRWTTVPTPYAQAEFDSWMDRAELWASEADLRKNYILVDSDDQLLGMVGLVRVRAEDHNAELGYWMAPPARCRGLLTQALTTLLGETLRAGYQRVDAEVLVGNVASQRVLERVGFTHEGILRSVGSHGCGVDQTRIGVHVYSVILSDPVAQKLLQNEEVDNN
jgi:RimJ/RimL family protein N-acetyltransferase